MWGVSRLAEDLLASKEGLCSMELVTEYKMDNVSVSMEN
jgi:hypothetical protein